MNFVVWKKTAIVGAFQQVVILKSLKVVRNGAIR